MVRELLENSNYRDSLESKTVILELQGYLKYIDDANQEAQFIVLSDLDADVGVKKQKLINQDFEEYAKSSPKEFIKNLEEANNPSFQNEIKNIKSEIKTRFIAEISTLESRL